MSVLRIQPTRPRRPVHHPLCAVAGGYDDAKCSCGLDELRERVEKLERVREAAKILRNEASAVLGYDHYETRDVLPFRIAADLNRTMDRLDAALAALREE